MLWDTFKTCITYICTSPIVVAKSAYIYFFDREKYNDLGKQRINELYQDKLKEIENHYIQQQEVLINELDTTNKRLQEYKNQVITANSEKVKLFNENMALKRELEETSKRLTNILTEKEQLKEHNETLSDNNARLELTLKKQDKWEGTYQQLLEKHADLEKDFANSKSFNKSLDIELTNLKLSYEDLTKNFQERCNTIKTLELRLTEIQQEHNSQINKYKTMVLSFDETLKDNEIKLKRSYQEIKDLKIVAENVTGERTTYFLKSKRLLQENIMQLETIQKTTLPQIDKITTTLKEMSTLQESLYNLKVRQFHTDKALRDHLEHSITLRNSEQNIRLINENATIFPNDYKTTVENDINRERAKLGSIHDLEEERELVMKDISINTEKLLDKQEALTKYQLELRKDLENFDTTLYKLQLSYKGFQKEMLTEDLNTIPEQNPITVQAIRNRLPQLVKNSMEPQESIALPNTNPLRAILRGHIIPPITQTVTMRVNNLAEQIAGTTSPTLNMSPGILDSSYEVD